MIEDDKKFNNDFKKLIIETALPSIFFLTIMIIFLLSLIHLSSIDTQNFNLFNSNKNEIDVSKNSKNNKTDNKNTDNLKSADDKFDKYYAEIDDKTINNYDCNKIATGSIINFGTYYDVANGKFSVPSIKFKIVSNDGENLLCISEKIIDDVIYDYEYNKNFDDSYIRSFLNEYLYKYFFSDYEKGVLCPIYKNDYITIPSIDEFKEMVEKTDFRWTTVVTSFAKEKVENLRNIILKNEECMWLRDSFYYTNFYIEGYKVNHLSSYYMPSYMGLRPIIKLNIKKYIYYDVNYKNIERTMFIDNDVHKKYGESNYELLNQFTVLNDKIKESIGKVYLTFDDGPSPLTESILDILDEKNVKATFFICGYENADKNKISQILERGHKIGIHAYNHNYKKIYSSEKSFIDDNKKLKNKIKKDFGVDVNIMRFPGGTSNLVSKEYKDGIMSKLIKTMHDNGYEFFDWSISSGDANTDGLTSDSVYENVINGLSPYKENIVLCHDSKGNVATIDALPKLIDEIKRQGYTFDSIGVDTPPYNTSAVN